MSVDIREQQEPSLLEIGRGETFNERWEDAGNCFWWFPPLAGSITEDQFKRFALFYQGPFLGFLIREKENPALPKVLINKIDKFVDDVKSEGWDQRRNFNKAYRGWQAVSELNRLVSK